MLHEQPESESLHSAHMARHGGPAWLAAALQASRRDTLATFAVYEAGLHNLQVPLRDELNPPLWELGHVGWFQHWWLGRNPQRLAGVRAEPEAPRAAAHRPKAEALYHSTRVAHASRWNLALPSAASTRAELAVQLQASLGLLAHTPATDQGLYFHRLVLLHEDMHHEAALYMARGLGLEVADARWRCPQLPMPAAALHMPSGTWQLGQQGEGGFHFDNECGTRSEALGEHHIDAQVLRWAEYLPFVAAGGYQEPAHWMGEPWAWWNQHKPQAPRYLRQEGGQWQQWRAGQWKVLDETEPACHLTAHEAQAWCRWAGRRLPTEAEWERAATTQGEAFRWGDVWEWTASPFMPFEGFVPHPYRDYSAPWFDGRPVLRGASHLTQARMRHLRYRNFYQPHRNDVAAGFRSCSL